MNLAFGTLHIGKKFEGVWRFHIPLKVKFFLWRCFRGTLPTKKSLADRGIILEETAQHIFLSCQGFAGALGRWSSRTGDVPLPSTLSIILSSWTLQNLSLWLSHGGWLGKPEMTGFGEHNLLQLKVNFSEFLGNGRRPKLQNHVLIQTLLQGHGFLLLLAGVVIANPRGSHNEAIAESQSTSSWME